MLFPGERVRCVNDEPENGLALPIAKDGHYTIKTVKEHPFLGAQTVTIREVTGRNEFWADRFVPARGA